MDDVREGILLWEVDAVEVEGVRRDKGATLLLWYCEGVVWVDNREEGYMVESKER